MFDMMDAARLEGLHLAQDPATGLKAIIAIHSTRLGPALGGCRYLPYPNDEAAIGDAIRLAQGMSYKAALAGLEQGGGKAVIIRPPHLDNRGALFEAFGRFIESLGGRYITAVDSGTSSADMDCIAQQTRHVTSTTQAGDPSPHTALGVFAGIRASAQARLGSDDLEGLRVAVQGSATSIPAGCNWPSSSSAPIRWRRRHCFPPHATSSRPAGWAACSPARASASCAARRWPGRRTTSWSGRRSPTSWRRAASSMRRTT